MSMLDVFKSVESALLQHGYAHKSHWISISYSFDELGQIRTMTIDVKRKGCCGQKEAAGESSLRSLSSLSSNDISRADLSSAGGNASSDITASDSSNKR